MYTALAAYLLLAPPGAHAGPDSAERMDSASVDSVRVDSTFTGPLPGDPLTVIEDLVRFDIEDAETSKELAILQDRYLAAEARCLEGGGGEAALFIASELLLAAESLAQAGELGSALELVNEAITELEAAVGGPGPSRESTP